MGPASARTGRRHAQSQESRRRILQATIELAADNGYDAATVAKVVEATGLPASSIYWHFGNKDRLLAEALDHSYRIRRERRPVWPIPAASNDVADAVDELMRSGGEIGPEDHYLRLGLMLLLERRTPEPEARKQFLVIRQEVVHNLDRWWAGLFRRNDWRGGPAGPRTMTRLSLAALDGRYISRHALPSSMESSPVLVQVLAHAAHYLLANPEAVVRRHRAPAEVSAGTVPAELVGRERLLRAAEQIAVEYGLEGATVARICQRAELPASSLYWFFDSKEDLIAEAVTTGYARSVRVTHWDGPPASPEPASTRELLTRLLRSGLGGMVAQSSTFRIGHLLMLRQRDDAGQRAFIRIRQQFAIDRSRWYQDGFGLDAELARGLAWVSLIVADGLLLGSENEPRWRVTDFAELLAAGVAGTIHAD